ncbi:hypothetical protein GCM10011533_21900 [Streptosporangium jomthongense]|uniref:Riboflavin biosynthesis protein RibA n=1 Tax=Marinobacter aromaticivorans TaxID=1494078 RepID=A0ABW2IVH4_9GAMM|nr:hypothetical protein [Marinobacter aromaticivorans]GGE69125.1 hypothetical protein GCM10011533_21900 [Streptosporangium jomthongense]
MSEYGGLVLGENYSHKISEEFDSQVAAERGAESLENLGIPLAQIRIIQPNDPSMAQKVEPETQGIARSMVKAHVWFGLIGLVVGLAVAGLLVTVGPALTRSSPVMTFIAMGFLFPVLALLIAGAVSLRPDHDLIIEKARTAKENGRWTVVAHCDSLEQQKLAKTAMHHSTQTL